MLFTPEGIAKLPPLPVEEQRAIVVNDGFCEDAETGKVLGHETLGPDFEILGEETAQLLIAELHQRDARIAALQLEKKIHIDRINDHYDRLINREEGRKKYLLWIHWGSVVSWAKTQKDRTLHLVFGKIEKRKNPSRLALKEGIPIRHVCDPETPLPSLIIWAGEHYPDAIKDTYEFQISKLPKDVLIDDLPSEYFEMTDETETVTIDTGVTRIKESDITEPEEPEKSDG